MLKKILGLILVGVMVLSLSACGNENSKLQGKYYSNDGNTILDFDGKGTLIWNSPKVTLAPMSKYNYKVKGNNIFATYLGMYSRGEWDLIERDNQSKQTWKYNFIDDDTLYLEYDLELSPKSITLTKNNGSEHTNFDKNSNKKVLTTKKEREEAIIGTWIANQGKDSIIFNADGTYEISSTITGSLETFKGEWYINGDKLCYVTKWNTIYANLNNWTGESLQFISKSKIDGQESNNGMPYIKLY